MITRGGTYRGSWRSTDPKVPVITIKTSRPVIIERSRLEGPGPIISGRGINLTVRDNTIVGRTPLVPGMAQGRFIYAWVPKNLVVTNNDVTGTIGIYVLRFGQPSDAKHTIRVIGNRVRNLDGRRSDGQGGYAGSVTSLFVQFNSVQDISFAEIAWNEVINTPGASLTADVINMFKSSGTAASPIRIHDNYIQGSYPANPAADSFSGGGIMLGDGDGSTGEYSGYVHAYHNQVVATANYGIAVSAGHDNVIRENRVIACGFLPNGQYIKSMNVGIVVWDYYGGSGTSDPSAFVRNVAANNTSGHMKRDSNGVLRNSPYWLPGCARDAGGASQCTGNLAVPASCEMEASEYASWLAKIRAAGARVGAATPAR